MSVGSTSKGFLRCHLDKIGVGGSLVLFASIWFGSSIAAGIGIAVLIASSLLNVWFVARPAR
jgi:hypothetical protein